MRSHAARQQAEALQVARNQAFKDDLAKQGYEPLALEGAHFGRIIKDGLAKWARVVKERNIKVE